MNKKSKILKYIVALLGLFLALFIIINHQYKSSINTAVNPEDTSSVSFQIKEGETAKTIAKKLEENDLINSSFFFLTYLKINDLEKNLLFGRFILKRNMNVKEIVEALSNPQNAEVIFTIQEGLRIKDIDKKLAQKDLIKEGEFIEAAKNFNGWEYYSFLEKERMDKLDLPVEGYIYPDTYYLDSSTFKPHNLIYLGMDNFEQKFLPLSEEISDKSVHEIITMASIIENEVFGEEDRKIVSGILWKRLENSWPLGADATLLYITEDRTITAQDLELDSPYNTRKFLNLPPGPICNPSIESIEAAIFPKESPYWFYLTTLDTGEVIYSKSNEEHNANKAKYLY